MAADLDAGESGIHLVTAIWQPERLRRLDEVVLVRRLVVEDRDRALPAGAERVLHGDIDVAVRKHGDVLGAASFPDLVERARVRSVERAHRAMGRRARRVGGLVDIARSRAGARRATGTRASCRTRSAARAGGAARTRGAAAATAPTNRAAGGAACAAAPARGRRPGRTTCARGSCGAGYR